MQMINPGVEMAVLVTASFTESSRDIQHVPVKLRQCLFYDESSYLPFYTYSDCLLKCRMQFLQNKCNCTPFNIPKLNNSRTCDLRDIGCLKMYYTQSITIRPLNVVVPPELELDLVAGGIPCPMCYPTCSKTSYSFYFFNVNIFPDILNAVPDVDRDDWLQGANFSGTSIVHVKYQREIADCFEQTVIMQWFDLLGNIGSTCGVLTGFSFVSVLEFIYFFTVMLLREVKKRKQQDINSLVNDNINQRHGQIYWNELTMHTPSMGNPYVEPGFI